MLGHTRKLKVGLHPTVEHTGHIHITSWQSQNNWAWHVWRAWDSRWALTQPERQILFISFSRLYKWGSLALVLFVTKLGWFNQVEEMLFTPASLWAESSVVMVPWISNSAKMFNEKWFILKGEGEYLTHSLFNKNWEFTDWEKFASGSWSDVKYLHTNWFNKLFRRIYLCTK